MARRLSRASTESINYAAPANFNWTFGTVVVCLKPITNPAGVQYFTLADMIAAADDRYSLFLDGDNSGRLTSYNGTGGALISAGLTVPAASGWQIAGVTKATGTATPRFHTYKWTTNSWTHTNGGATDVNAALTLTFIRIGNDFFGGGAAFVDEDYAAVMMAPGWAPTDSEFERLARGYWDRFVDIGTPGFLIEFPSGRDQPPAGVGGARSVGRVRVSPSSITGTTRSPLTDPPGFKFSRLTRRR